MNKIEINTKKKTEFLRNNEDKDLRELGEVFTSMCKSGMTLSKQKEYDEYTYDWMFRTRIIQQLHYEGIPPEPSECRLYRIMNKAEKRDIDTQKENMIKMMMENWRTACRKVKSENIFNIHWLKHYKKIAEKYNDEDRLMTIKNLLATFPDDFS